VKKGALLIDSSTIDVESARKAHAIAASNGLPVGRRAGLGRHRRRQGRTLTFMVGGSAEAFDVAEPMLKPWARSIVHCGDAGAGQAAKICNNMILGISMIGVAEAFVLAEKLGLSHQALFDVASTSSGQCWSLTTYCPVPGPVPTSPANNDYKPGFAAALMLKDLKLAQEAGRRPPAPALGTPLGAWRCGLINPKKFSSTRCPAKMVCKGGPLAPIRSRRSKPKRSPASLPTPHVPDFVASRRKLARTRLLAGFNAAATDFCAATPFSTDGVRPDSTSGQNCSADWK
jgi:hypothetical protein